jgi:hypothetical protein
MGGKDILFGSIATLVAFGAYFLGAFQGQRNSVAWHQFFASCARSLSRKGFLCVVAFPVSWLVVFYGLVAHVRIALGRWPNFGESFNGWALSAHSQATWYLAAALVVSLYPAPLVLIGCLFFQRFRHVSIYSLTYATAVGLAFGAMLLAPGPFLNWFFD